jgi:ABC-2 type transport system ATP-binding protein
LNIRYSATKTSAEEVFQMLRQNQIAIRDVKTSQADLEDVFLELTKSA